MKLNNTIKYLIAVMIYGTNGFFVHFINASSEFVAMCRGLIGSLFILLVMFASKDLPNKNSINKNLDMLVLSGISLGLNWVFLFAGYKYAIAITSLLNYLAPIMVIVITSFIYKEKLNNKQIICIFMALVGIVLISGLFDGHISNDIHCFIYGILAAIGFVSLVLCNRKIKGIKPLDKTVVQLFVSFLTVLPFVIFNNGLPSSLDTTSILILIMMGIINTGVAYIFYFGSINTLPVHKIAIIGYIEPVLSIIIGVLVFKEPISMYGVIGAVMILSAALLSELFAK